MKKILLSIFFLLIVVSRVQTAYAIEGSVNVPGVGIIPIPEGSEIIPNPNGGGNGQGGYEIVFPPGSGIPPMCTNEIIPPSGPPENIPPPDTCVGESCGGGGNPPTPTPKVPACGVDCTTPADCLGARDSCTSCVNKTCQAGPTPTPKVPACGTACTTPADCLGAKDSCTSCVDRVCAAAPTPTPKVPACGTACTTPADCLGAKDSCTSCVDRVCKVAPTPTPKVPACGVPCDIPGDCEAARDGCTVCKANASGTKVCTAAPTPTPKVPACGTACTTPADCLGAKDSCTSCINNVCKVAPTPTPNPFSQTMCKCDGITLDPTTFTAGQKLTITSFAKVEGGDTSYATVPNMLFTSSHQTDPKHETRDVPYEVPIATAIVENTASKVRYKAVWSYTVPANPDPALTYKIRAVPQCVQKSAGIQSVSRIADVSTAEGTQPNTNILTRVFNFIMGIFGKKPASQAGKIQSGSGDNLQLDTFRIGTITGTDHCSYIEYQVK